MNPSEWEGWRYDGDMMATYTWKWKQSIKKKFQILSQEWSKGIYVKWATLYTLVRPQAYSRPYVRIMEPLNLTSIHTQLSQHTKHYSFRGRDEWEGGPPLADTSFNKLGSSAKRDLPCHSTVLPHTHTYIGNLIIYSSFLLIIPWMFVIQGFEFQLEVLIKGLIMSL